MTATKKARRKSTKATGRVRDYDKEYAQYHGKPAEVKKRAQRNSARSAVAKTRTLTKDQVVDHKKPIRKGGTNAPSNLRVTSRKKNAGWRKGKKG